VEEGETAVNAAFVGFLTILAQATPIHNNSGQPAPPPSPQEEFRTLVKEYADAMKEYRRAIDAAKTTDERKRIDREKYPLPEKYLARCTAIAKKNPKDPAAVDALVWVVAHSFSSAEKAKAVSRLAKDHSQDARLGAIAGNLGGIPGPSSEKILLAILEKNPDHVARGRACFGLARFFRQKAALARTVQNATALQETELAADFGLDVVKDLKKSDPAQFEKLAEQYCEQTLTNFSDVNHYDNKTLGDAAKGTLFELRYLSVGKVAPEIAGEDVDGAKFKLSDYRGKVVLLDFWGNW
jgi:hypothetical protein